jgi:hypothetical protein
VKDHIETLPVNRFAGRAHEIKERMLASNIPAKGSYLDPSFNGEAIQILASFRKQYSEKANPFQTSAFQAAADLKLNRATAATPATSAIQASARAGEGPGQYL